MQKAVRFHQASAILWVVAGGLAFVFGWHDAVWAVWIASVYANAKTDWSTAEAAKAAKGTDNEEVLNYLKRVLEEVQQIRNDPTTSGVELLKGPKRQS